MGYIKHLTIIGLKKFKKLDIDFNKNMNILVGENEVGKSTILEAINIVLNQKYKNADKSVIKELLNKENEDAFFKEKTVSALPKIQIEIVLAMMGNERDCMIFGVKTVWLSQLRITAYCMNVNLMMNAPIF